MARVLIIDDDAEILFALRQTLNAAGYEIVEAPAGSNVMELQEQTPADLAIVDMFMPEKDGFEIIEELRQSFSGLKIIAMSEATVSSAMLKMAKVMGARWTLTKPFMPDELLGTVTEALEAS